MKNSTEANVELKDYKKANEFITRSPLAFPESLGKANVNKTMTGTVIGADFGIANSERNKGKKYGIELLKVGTFTVGVLMQGEEFAKEGTEYKFRVNAETIPDTRNPGKFRTRYTAEDIEVVQTTPEARPLDVN